MFGRATIRLGICPHSSYIWFSLVLRCDSCRPVVGASVASRSLSLFGWLLNKKAARVEVNILLAFFHWIRG